MSLDSQIHFNIETMQQKTDEQAEEVKKKINPTVDNFRDKLNENLQKGQEKPDL